IHQIHEEFKRSNFIDCKINAFASVKKPVPNFIFIDLDIINKTSLTKILKIALKNIKNRLGGSPTVLWTGNGLHLYQPLSSPMQIEDIKDFKDFENPDNRFLRFEKDYLSGGYADKANHPSLKSCMLRVPGSLNSKCVFKGMKADDSRVIIMNPWDSFRPSIFNQLGTYYSYLISEEIKNLKKEINRDNDFRRYSSTFEIQWIENLLKTPLDDYRKFCLWRILIPYLINIKKTSQNDTFVVLNEWLIASNSMRKLDFNPKMVIILYMKNVNNFKPISLSKLKKENPNLYNLINGN
ncbi:MAG TPA: hypothetical protein VFV86_12000, partial [Nitrososphaeraceae archaeon]|nr:hypothetical protein [Nitrososphaeraceae archaeon]